MEFIQIGEFFGQPASFEDVTSKLLGPAFADIFEQDTKFLLVNWHRPREALNMPYMNAMLEGHISKRASENRNVIVVVNWGWTHANDYVTIRHYMDSLQLCNCDAIEYEPDLARNGEISFSPKPMVGYHDKIPENLAVWYKSRYGYSVLYFLWDAFHVVSSNGVKEIRREVMPFAHTAYREGVFLKKYCPGKETKCEGDKVSADKFVSIYDKALEVIGGVGAIESIKKEMLEKAPIKQIVLFVNQVIHSAGQDQQNPTAHTDKKEITKWLEDWADKKWPYYVMFGNKFEAQLPIQYEVDIERDKFTIDALIADLKVQFPQFALVLHQFSKEEIIKNKINRMPSSLAEFTTVEPGTKLSKFLSSFLDNQKFDLELSKVVGLTKLDSIIHISINPMDFMTSAVNKCGWTTCHNLYGGCHANGGLSYMFDSGSLIAFMASNRQYLYDLDHKGKPFAWNSKSWRQLVYGDYHHNSFIFVREYPTEGHDENGSKDRPNEVARENTRKFFEQIVSDFCGTANSWIIKRNGSIGCKHHEPHPNQTGYEDIERNGRNHVLVFPKNHRDFPKIEVGMPLKCIKTGEVIMGSSTRIFKRGSI